MAADGMTIAWSGDGSGAIGASPAIGTSGRALAAPDDRILIERAQAGDREAFEELVHRYDRDVLRIASERPAISRKTPATFIKKPS